MSHFQRDTLARASTFVRPDDVCARECGEARSLDNVRFQWLETSFPEQLFQRLEASPSSAKARRSARTILFVFEVGDDESPPWLEYAGDFRQSLTLEWRWQVMHHQCRKHHVEGLVREGKPFDDPCLEVNRQMAPGRFRPSAVNLRCPWINRRDVPCRANTARYLQRQCSRATANIERRLSRPQLRQVKRSAPEFAQPATKRESIMKPPDQVIAPAAVENQPLCRWSGPLIWWIVTMACASEGMHDTFPF